MAEQVADASFHHLQIVGIDPSRPACLRVEPWDAAFLREGDGAAGFDALMSPDHRRPEDFRGLPAARAFAAVPGHTGHPEADTAAMQVQKKIRASNDDAGEVLGDSLRCRAGRRARKNARQVYAIDRAG